MREDSTFKPFTFLMVFIGLFLLSTFATSYRKAVQAAIPVTPLTVKGFLSLTPHSLKQKEQQPSSARSLKNRPPGQQSMHKVIEALAPELRPKLEKVFASKGITYPPQALTLIALKAEKRIELWSPDETGNEKLIITYPILAASGDIGPKLLQGDLQVPEGFYKVLWFNPNSEFYLSLKIDYPNSFDQRMAKLDGRTDLGGDIFIHGYDVSLGCLAIGNPAIEEVFLLIYDTGRKNTQVIITPYDFREKYVPESWVPASPSWAGTLYNEIKKELLLYTDKSREEKAG